MGLKKKNRTSSALDNDLMLSGREEPYSRNTMHMGAIPEVDNDNYDEPNFGGR